MDFERWKGAGGGRGDSAWNVVLRCCSSIQNMSPFSSKRTKRGWRSSPKPLQRTLATLVCDARAQRRRPDKVGENRERKGACEAQKQSSHRFQSFESEPVSFSTFFLSLFWSLHWCCFFYALDIIPVSRRNGQSRKNQRTWHEHWKQ
jgi:hypothetical protein